MNILAKNERHATETVGVVWRQTHRHTHRQTEVLRLLQYRLQMKSLFPIICPQYISIWKRCSALATKPLIYLVVISSKSCHWNSQTCLQRAWLQCDSTYNAVILCPPIFFADDIRVIALRDDVVLLRTTND